MECWEDNKERIEDKRTKFGVKQTRILITGCAGCGNTLLRRLFHAFADVDVLLGDKKVRKDGSVSYKGDEVTLEDLINRSSDAPFVVGKRVKHTIFSTDIINEDGLKRQAEIIRRNNVKIINTIRDGRDVILSTVTSKRLPIGPRRWIHCMRHRDAFRKLITLEVRYEDLVTNPNVVQDAIAERFWLTPIHSFSDYPDFLPDKEYDTRQFRANPTKAGDKRERYRPKRINADRVGKDLNAYKKIIKKETLRRHFEEELGKAGYI